jgi:putative NADH-flavin reductase
VGAGFEVTIITRPGSTSSFPAGLPLIRVDYADVDELATALAGQDAVVSAVGPGAIGAAPGMVDAAARAGVKRYISELQHTVEVFFFLPSNW